MPTKVQELLVKALLQMAERPDLTEAEIDWIYRFALRLIVDLGVNSKPDENVAA